MISGWRLRFIIMKILFTDLDGTLVNNQDPINIRDIEALHKFQKEGHKVVLCTGRTYHETEALLGYIPYDYLILSNGGQIRDKKEILFNHLIDQKTGIKILDDLMMKTSDLFFGDARGMFCYKDHHTYKITDKPYLIDSSFQNEYRQSEGFSIICIYARNHIDDLMNYCNQYQNTVTIHQNDLFIDIVPRDCSKKSGIEELMTLLKADQTIGIGNSYNDLPMIKAVDKGCTFYHASIDAEYKYHYVYELIEELLEGEKYELAEEFKKD